MAFYSIPASAFGFRKQNLRAFVRWEFARVGAQPPQPNVTLLDGRASCHFDA
jgi:hypothetical protein